jgi:peptide/nickel transport system permease protein
MTDRAESYGLSADEEVHAFRRRRPSGRINSSIAFIAAHKVMCIGGFVVCVFALAGVLAPVVAPYPPNAIDTSLTLQGPSTAHSLGTDALGRDLLSRVIFGARMSLFIALVSVVIGGIIGTVLGLLAARFRWCEGSILRVMDVLLAMPDLIIALVIIALLGAGITNMIVAIATYQVPQYARLVYGLAFGIRQRLFIDAAIVSGESTVSILFRYILPNCFGPVLVQTTLLLPSAIGTAATLSFLGLGVPPPTAEWGAMLQDGLTYIATTPLLILVPGVALTLVVLGFNILGDGLADLLDPRVRGRGRLRG